MKTSSMLLAIAWVLFLAGAALSEVNTAFEINGIYPVRPFGIAGLLAVAVGCVMSIVALRKHRAKGWSNVLGWALVVLSSAWLIVVVGAHAVGYTLYYLGSHT